MTEPIYFPDLAELRLARQAVEALKEQTAGLRITDLREALGLPSRARKIRRAVDRLDEAGVLDRICPPAGPVRWKLLRRPAPGELRVEPRRPKPGDTPSLLLDVLATAELGDDREVRVEVRAKHGQTFYAARTYIRDRPTRQVLYLREPEDISTLAAAFTQAAAAL